MMDQTHLRINVPETGKKRVVIIGGGFGGIELARELRDADLQVVMIDKNNYHTFQPLLYQVATAGLEPDSIAFPIRKIFKNHGNFFFRMACAKNIRPETKTVETSIGDLRYDYLVIATGSDTNFFGNKNVEHFSMPMKSIVEALDLRSLILQNFEQALLTTDPVEKQALMNIVIVGGGPTGVEMAGAIAELKRHILPKDYPELDFAAMKIYLVESSPALLGTFSKAGSGKTTEFLKDMQVDVMTNTLVLDYDGSTVKTKDLNLNAKTLIWAAGVAGCPVKGINAEAINRGNRYLIDEFNRVKGYTDIFAIGDVAAHVTEATPRGLPMVAPVAIQHAQNLAKNLVSIVGGKTAELRPFEYHDKGSMATIGRNKAIADIGKFHSQGFFAWLMWMFVHLFMLIGFRNKVIVFINWLWSYMIYDRGIRLIIRPFRRASQELYEMRKAG
jgi:NADH:ubiquinone reductase (H+-translocating)